MFLMGQPRLLCVYFCSFQTQILQKKIVGFSKIQTRIVGVEGEHVEPLTMAQKEVMFNEWLKSRTR